MLLTKIELKRGRFFAKFSSILNISGYQIKRKNWVNSIFSRSFTDVIAILALWESMWMGRFRSYAVICEWDQSCKHNALPASIQTNDCFTTSFSRSHSTEIAFYSNPNNNKVTDTRFLHMSQKTEATAVMKMVADFITGYFNNFVFPSDLHLVKTTGEIYPYIPSIVYWHQWLYYTQNVTGCLPGMSSHKPSLSSLPTQLWKINWLFDRRS